MAILIVPSRAGRSPGAADTQTAADGSQANQVVSLNPKTGLSYVPPERLATQQVPWRRRRVKPQWMQAYFTSTIAGTYYSPLYFVSSYDELRIWLSISAAITGVTTSGANLSCFLQLCNLKDDPTLTSSWINHEVDAAPVVIAAPGNAQVVLQTKAYTNFGAAVRTGLTIGTAWNATGNQNINVLLCGKG